MVFSRMTYACLVAAALLAAPAGLASACAQDAQTQGEPQGGGEHHGLFRMLSPEQRMMLFVQMHKETAGMTDDQKQAYREQQREKFRAMSDSDRQQFASELQAKWDALPPDQQQQIREQVQAFRAQRMQQMQQMQGGPQQQ